MGKHKRLKVHR